LGFGVANELIIYVRIYLLCLWTWINQNRHIQASDTEEAGYNEREGGGAWWLRNLAFGEIVSQFLVP
jgi:hypothetical protein